jgi:hypothetical protein
MPLALVIIAVVLLANTSLILKGLFWVFVSIMGVVIVGFAHLQQ